MKGSVKASENTSTLIMKYLQNITEFSNKTRDKGLFYENNI